MLLFLPFVLLTKLSGALNSPMIKLCEKFSVARAERNIPRKRRLKQWMSVDSWTVGRPNRERRNAVTRGRSAERLAVSRKEEYNPETGTLLKMARGTRPKMCAARTKAVGRKRGRSETVRAAVGIMAVAPSLLTTVVGGAVLLSPDPFSS
jgi:hypothetical protein